MKKSRWAICLLGTSLIILGNYAKADRAALVRDSKCAVQTNDPFEPALIFETGKYPGVCLETVEARSIRRLTPDEKETYGFANDPRVVVANFYHAGRFWFAAIDPAQIEQVYYQIEHFKMSPLFGHNQIRFRLNRNYPAELTEQAPSVGNLPLHTTVSDLAFSAEAVRGIGKSFFNFQDGLENGFAISYKLVSLDTRYYWMITRAKDRVEQIELNLTQSQMAAVLTHAIALGTEFGENYFYHLVTRNCTTELFRVLDEALGFVRSPSIAQRSASALGGQTYPLFAEMGLKSRHLLKNRKTAHGPDLDQDVEYLAQMARELPEPVHP